MNENFPESSFRNFICMDQVTANGPTCLFMVLNNDSLYFHMHMLVGFIFTNSKLLQDRTWAKNRVEFLNDMTCSSGRNPIGVNIDRNWFWYPKLSKIHNL